MVAQIDKPYRQTSLTRSLARFSSYLLFEGRPLTTRGRWINPLVFGLAKTMAGLPLSGAVDRPVFVLGTGRSGTTILGLVLSMHRDVGFLNEPKALWHEVVPDEDLVGSYTDVPGRYCLDAADATDTVRRRLGRIYQGYLALTGNTRVVDKYPEMVFRVPFLKALFPDARFIFLARNGNDTCHSIKRWSERHGTADGRDDWWGRDNRKWRAIVEQLVPRDPQLSKVDGLDALTSHTDMAAIEWILSMREGMRLVESDPESVLWLPYEQLAGEPEEALARVTNFCGLQNDPRFTAYATSVLKPPRPAGPVELDSRIAPAFRDTMLTMGYGDDL